MNALTPQNLGAMQLPAHLQGFTSNKLSQQVAANIGSAAPPYVSIQGNKFTLVDAAGNEQPTGAYDPQIGVYLDAVIIDVANNISKVYFDQVFDPSATTYQAPPCWSDNGTGPSRQAAKPQALLCSTCPKNEWGSATSRVSGKGVKACHDLQKVAVLVPGFPTLFQLRIPPNSLKNFRSYAERFNGQQFDMDVMITRVSFEPQGVGTLLFQAVNWIDQTVAGAIAQAREAKATDNLVGRNDVARDPNQPLAIAGGLVGGNVGVAAETAPAAVAPGFPGGGPAAVAQQPPFVPAQPAPTAAAPMAPQFSTPPGQPLASPTPQATPTAAAPGFAPTASPSETPAPRRRGRARAAEQAPPVAGPQAAPFPHPGQPAPQPAFGGAPYPNAGGTSTAAPAAPQPQTFGIQPGVAPDPALAAALATAFGVPK